MIITNLDSYPVHTGTVRPVITFWNDDFSNHNLPSFSATLFVCRCFFLCADDLFCPVLDENVDACGGGWENFETFQVL